MFAAAAAFALLVPRHGLVAAPAYQQVDAHLLVRVPAQADVDTVVLENPVGATRFADGTIAVADGMAPAVLLFDADGTFKGSVGRAGQGPGEFATPGWMGRCSEDHALVWDFSLLRFTTVDAAGRILTQAPLNDLFDVPLPPAILACSRAGHLAVLPRLSGKRIEGREISTMTSPLYVVRSGGRAVLLLEDAPVIEWINGERTYRPVSMTTHFAISDSLVYVARSDSMVVRTYDLEGGAGNAFSLDLRERKPTDTHVRRDAERHTAFYSDRATRSRIIEQFMQLPRPEHLPYHSGIHLDPAGRLWVVTSFPGDPSTTLRAFNLGGEPIGEVRIPTEIKVLEVGGDYILGSVEDPRTLEPGIVLLGFDLERR